MRVLIVDDAQFMRLTISRMIEHLGGQVVGEASDGVEAIRKYKELQPDLVTMDLTMPNMDGIEAVKQIKSIDPKANIIVCSAMGQQVMVLDAIRAGARDFVVKPFTVSRLAEALSKI